MRHPAAFPREAGFQPVGVRGPLRLGGVFTVRILVGNNISIVVDSHRDHST